MCGVVLRNSVPCVRNRDLRAKEEHPPPAPPGASDQGSEPLGPGPASANTVPEEHPALLRFRGAGVLWRPRLDAAWRRARMPAALNTALLLAALLAAVAGPVVAYACAKKWTRRNIAELVTGDPGLVDRINRHTWALSDGAIAVVGPPDSQQAHDVHQALEDTGLFKKGAIAHIPPQDLAGAARADLIILTEDALSAQTDGAGRARLLDDVLGSKRGIHAGLIGYAPTGDLTDNEFQAIGSEPITSVTRTRGRLVNDAISMLTTLSRVQGQ